VTGDNRRKNIAVEAKRGDDSLESAQILLAAAKYADAVSRAYYGAFHYARALLLTLGEEPETHAGVHRLLHRDLVRDGTLDPNVAHLFSRLQRFRLDADYSAEVVFTNISATEEVRVAETFVAEARAILQRGNWLAI
jgi:uncharacterized protein (UPF0332 family)